MGENASGESGLDGDVAEAREEDAVAELHDGIRRHPQNERCRDGGHFPVAARPSDSPVFLFLAFH